MKKHLLWIAFAAVVGMAAMQKQVKEVIAPAKPVDKNISFAVYKGNNYTSNAYRNTSAQVTITVEKVNGNRRTKVWEKTLDAKQLSEYPSAQNALTQKVTVPNVFDKKEHIEVTYTLTYDSRGSQLQMQGDAIVAEDTSTGYLNISI